MTTEQDPTDTVALDLARECLYRFLAEALTDPYTVAWTAVTDPENQTVARTAADLLRDEAGRRDVHLGFGELPPAHLNLGPVLRELARPIEELRSQFDHVFGLVGCTDCPPHESEYHRNREPFFRAQQMADAAGFYQAFGLRPRLLHPERPDHVALELEFMAFLLTKKRLALAMTADGDDAGAQAGVCDETQRTFFRDHLIWWAPAFARALERKSEGGLYAALAAVLAAFLPVERAVLGLDALPQPQVPRPDAEPEESGCAGCLAHTGAP
jgi:TorA maturation chaperone TorD